MFADTFCCQQLSAIQFSTNLPVLIANTGGVPVSNNSGEAAICTCGVEAKGNKGGDYNGTVKFETRGGTDTRLPLLLSFLAGQGYVPVLVAPYFACCGLVSGSRLARLL